MTNVLPLKKDFLTEVKTELSWYYGQAHSDLGICSSYNSIIAQAHGFSSHSNLNVYETNFLAIIAKSNSPVKRLRKIEHTLANIPLQSRRVLDATYNSYPFQPQLISVFDNKTGPALFNTSITDLHQLLKLCDKSLKHCLKAEEDQLLVKIKKEAIEIYNQVHYQFWIESLKK